MAIHLLADVVFAIPPKLMLDVPDCRAERDQAPNAMLLSADVTALSAFQPHAVLKLAALVIDAPERAEIPTAVLEFEVNVRVADVPIWRFFRETSCFIILTLPC
jgi:hypothetical protein